MNSSSQTSSHKTVDHSVLVRLTLLYTIRSSFHNVKTPDQDLIWETVSSSTGDGYDPSQMNTHHGNLRLRLDTLQAQDRKRERCRYDEDGFTTGTQVAGTGSSRGSWREERVREKERGEMYRDTSSSGILKMKVPVRLSHGGFVEVGLREKKKKWVGRHSCSGSRRGGGVEEEEEEEEGTSRSLLYVRHPFFFYLFFLLSFFFFSCLLI